MGMAGWVRLGGRALRALPATTASAIGFEADDIEAVCTDVDVSEEEASFGLYPDLADMIAADGGVGDLPEESRPEGAEFEVNERGWLKGREN